MEFGRVSHPEKVDFHLEMENPQTLRVLTRKTKNEDFKFYFGCAKWGRKDWIGKIYPQGTNEKDFLKHYCRYFNAIELNATFYNTPQPLVLENWRHTGGVNFLFCPKFPRGISHTGKENRSLNFADFFVNRMETLGEALGPFYIQFPPYAKPALAETVDFLKALPKGHQYFIEFRHEDWFSNKYFNQVFDEIEALGLGAIITDSAGRRDVVHMRLTIPEAFIRFVGNWPDVSDKQRIQDWANVISYWRSQGLHKVYFFMHQHEEMYSPEAAAYCVEIFNKVCDARLNDLIIETMGGKV